MIGLLGSKNDYLAVSVTGSFDEALEEYLQDWLPGGRLFLKKSTPVGLDENELIEEHGFTISRPSKRRSNPDRTLSRMKDGIKSVYKNGKMNAGAQLKGEKITTDRIEFIIDKIDETIETLGGE